MVKPKSSHTKFKKEITQDWKKNNPGKVKAYAAKYNASYYQRIKEKRSLKFKIQYHQNAIRKCIPYEYDEFVDNNKLQLITVDHNYFDKRFPKPEIFWKNIKSCDLTVQEIQTNIDYVIRLQNKNIIPIFLVQHVESYLLYNKLDSLRYQQSQRLLGVKKEEWGKHFKEHEVEQNKLFIKLLDENYQKHIVKTMN